MASNYGKCPKCDIGKLVKTITNFKVSEEDWLANHIERIKCDSCDYLHGEAEAKVYLTEGELKNFLDSK